MNLEEAVDSIQRTIRDYLTEPLFEDYTMDVIEEVAIAYYGGVEIGEEGERLDQAMEHLPDLVELVWADVAAIALHRIADEWAKHRPEGVMRWIPQYTGTTTNSQPEETSRIGQQSAGSEVQ